MMRGLALTLLLVACAPGQETTAYDRSEWGRWRSTDERGANGCRWDSRGIALRDAAAHEPELLVVRDEPGRVCRVVALAFVDRYTDERYVGPGNKVDVDHLVPVAEAHRSGGWIWSSKRKSDFYNDASNHVPTPEAVNASKSDRDPRSWLPPDLAARCWYAETYIAVKAKWDLLMDDDERQALAEIEECDT